MAHCEEYIDLISTAIDGALSPEERDRLNAHLASCPECKALYEEFSALHTALSDLPPVEVPADLSGRILEAVAAETVIPFAPPKKKSSLRRGWLASAAVLAIMLLGTWSWKPWERMDRTVGSAPAAGVAISQDPPSREERESAPLNDAVQSPDPNDEIMLLTNDSAEPSPTDTPDPLPAPAEAASIAPTAAEDVSFPAPSGPAISTPSKAKEAPAIPEAGTGSEEVQPRLRMAGLSPEEPEASTSFSPETVEETVTMAPTLFSAPLPTPEAADGEGPNQQPLTLQTTSLPLETTNDLPELTVEEALDLTADYCFAGSGYNTVREEPDSPVPSAHFSLEEDGVSITGGTIVYTGEDETFFFFECQWDDDPENPYHYSVHKLQRYVAWQGESSIDGEFRP